MKNFNFWNLKNLSINMKKNNLIGKSERKPAKRKIIKKEKIIIKQDKKLTNILTKRPVFLISQSKKFIEYI